MSVMPLGVSEYTAISKKKKKQTKKMYIYAMINY